MCGPNISPFDVILILILSYCSAVKRIPNLSSFHHVQSLMMNLAMHGFQNRNFNVTRWSKLNSANRPAESGSSVFFIPQIIISNKGYIYLYYISTTQTVNKFLFDSLKLYLCNNRKLFEVWFCEF